MKKVITAILMMASFSSFATITSLSGVSQDIIDLYSGLGGNMNDYGTYGYINAVEEDASEFVEAYRGAATVATFDPDTWTVQASDGSGVDSLETARDNLRTSETNLVNKITTDLIGDGTVANTWSTGELAQARSQGGLVGKLSASIQEQTRDLTNLVSTGAADIQDVYESEEALQTFFEVTTTEITALENRVNNTRTSVANARDGFAITTADITGNNTGRIVADAGNNSLSSTVYTNTSGDHIQVSDFFTSADALVIDGNELFSEIHKQQPVGDFASQRVGFTEDVGAGTYTKGIFQYSSFTDLVIERNGTQVLNEFETFAGTYNGVTYALNADLIVHIDDIGVAREQDDQVLVSKTDGTNLMTINTDRAGNTGGKTSVYDNANFVTHQFLTPQLAVDWVVAELASR